MEESAWNFFDLLLAASGLADVCIQLAGADMPDARLGRLKWRTEVSQNVGCCGNFFVLAVVIFHIRISTLGAESQTPWSLYFKALMYRNRFCNVVNPVRNHARFTQNLSFWRMVHIINTSKMGSLKWVRQKLYSTLLVNGHNMERRMDNFSNPVYVSHIP